MEIPKKWFDQLLFSQFDVSEYNSKSDKAIANPITTSPDQPVGHRQELSVPVPLCSIDDVLQSRPEFNECHPSDDFNDECPSDKLKSYLLS